MSRYNFQISTLFALLLLAYHIQGILTIEKADVYPDYAENEIDDYPNLVTLFSNKNKQKVGNRGLVDVFFKKSGLHNQKFPGKAIPFFKTLPHSSCSCEMDYETKDLGIGYYPRYLRTGKCNMDSCGKYRQCRQREYKVEVFKRRDDSETEVPSSEAPQRNWEPTTVNVVVACECVSNPFLF